MRTVLVIVVVAIVACLLIPGLWMHTKQVPRDIGGVIDRSVPDSHVQGVYETALGQAEKDLEDLYTKVYKAKAEIDRIQPIVTSQKDQLAKQEQILKGASAVLDQEKPGSIVTVAGRDFSWDQVKQDAESRLNTCKELRTQIAGNQQSLVKLQCAYTAGLKAITDKRDQLRREKMDFEAAKIRMIVARAQQNVNELVGSIGQPSDSTELAAARKLFSSRLQDLEARNEYSQQFNPVKQTVVPWDEQLGLTKSVTAEIDSYFKEHDSSVSTPATVPATLPASADSNS